MSALVSTLMIDNYSYLFEQQHRNGAGVKMPCSKPVLSNAAEFPLQLDGCSVKVIVNDLLVYELIREWRKEIVIS